MTLERITWTKFNLKMHVGLYNSFEDIKEDEPRMYKAIEDLNLFDELKTSIRKYKATQTRPQYARKKESMTYGQIIAKARMVSSIEEFKEKYKLYYERAKETNLLAEAVKAFI